MLDFAAATGNPALLDALADNFSAGVFHRQSSPESRDWLARLIGTREVWQSTDRTGGGGSFAEGSGSRRRVREFLVRPDEFRTLDTGRSGGLDDARAGARAHHGHPGGAPGRAARAGHRRRALPAVRTAAAAGGRRARSIRRRPRLDGAGPMSGAVSISFARELRLSG